MRARRRRGYSLVEIGLAVCVMSIGILGVLAAFSFSLRSVDHARYMSEALSVGRTLVEQIRAYNLPDWSAPWPASDNSGLFDDPSARRAINDLPFTTVTPNDRYTRNVLVTRLGTDPADYHSGIARIQVTVYWNENGVDKNVVVRSEFKQP